MTAYAEEDSSSDEENGAENGEPVNKKLNMVFIYADLAVSFNVRTGYYVDMLKSLNIPQPPYNLGYSNKCSWNCYWSHCRKKLVHHNLCANSAG